MERTSKEYNAIHTWMARNFIKTGVCDHCFKEGYTEWSNKTGKYKRDFRDWQELCRKCHYKYDTEILGKKNMSEVGKLGGLANGSGKAFAIDTDLARRAGALGGSRSKKGVQSRNKSSIMLKYKGKVYYQAELARKLGLSRQRIGQLKKDPENEYGITFV